MNLLKSVVKSVTGNAGHKKMRFVGITMWEREKLWRKPEPWIKQEHL
jgi:hypothetical protein